MSGRCRACDCIMSEQDMKQKWPDSDEFSELCGYCLDIAIDPDSIELDEIFLDFDDEIHNNE